MRRNSLNSAVIFIWIANLAACLFVVVLFAWFNKLPNKEAVSIQTPMASSARSSKLSGHPSITPVSTPISKPTITPWPTPIAGPSVTPMTMALNKFVIGYSIENRPQEVYRFGQGPINKLIIAGIHGGSEWNTIELADQLIAYFNDNPDRIPADISLFILEDLNPDGTARAHGLDGRVNANGVDLNRNWPYNWKSDWPKDGCWDYRNVSGGQSAGSEPEIQNVIAFIDEIKPTALISYHSAALGISAGGRPDFAPSISLAEAVAKVSNYPYPPLKSGCDYTGDLTDWAANTRSIPAIDIELTNHDDTDFDQNLRVLQVFLTWNQ